VFHDVPQPWNRGSGERSLSRQHHRLDGDGRQSHLGHRMRAEPSSSSPSILMSGVTTTGVCFRDHNVIAISV